MSYTQVDIDNSTKFAEANNRIRIIQVLYRKMPNLTSHLKVTVRDATDDDYYRPQALLSVCKVVDVEITETLCGLLSCNPARETGMCDPNSKASYYRVGDDSWDLQCQPACFNTAAKATFNDDGSRAPDVPMLNYHSGKCRLVNSTMVSYLEKTFYRSDTHYENRLNDMPTGFSRTKSDNPYGSGLEYRTNDTYCGYYDRIRVEDGSCDMTVFEKILDSIIGMSLINTVRSTIRMTENNHKPFDDPPNLPPLPTQLPREATLEGWKENIDPSFIVPSLIDVSPSRPGGDAAAVVATTAATDTSSVHDERRKREISTDIHEHGPTGRGMSTFMKQKYNIPYSNDDDNSHHRIKRDLEPDVGQSDSDKLSWMEELKKILIAMLESATTDPNFWVTVGIGVVTDKTIDFIKSLCTRIIEKMSQYITKEMIDLSGSIGVKVLSSCLRGMSVKLLTGMVVRIGSKLAIMLAKVAAAAASVIGWILVGTMLLDILFTFWDPYGYNNLFPPKMPKVLMDNGELSFRKALESATCNYEFESFAGTILSHDELMIIQIQSFSDRLIYLDSLTVNSEGSRIDKGDLMRLNGGTATDAEIACHMAMAKRVRFDPNTYRVYNQDFLDRVTIHRRITRVSAIALVSGIAMCLLDFNILGAFIILLALIILSINRYMLQDDKILDAVRHLRFAKLNDDTSLSHITSNNISQHRITSSGQTSEYGIHKTGSLHL